MGEYREYLRIPGVKPLLFASTFGRLSYAMVSLAIFFQVQTITGSVGTAGLAVGLSSGLGAMTAGPRGLIVDRFAQTRPLFAFVPAYAVSCLLLAFVAQDALSAVLLSGLIGLTAPPINISIRPLWLDIVGPGPRAHGLQRGHGVPQPRDAARSRHRDAGRAERRRRSWASPIVGVSMLVGGLLLAFNSHSRAWVPEEREHGEAGLLRSPAIRFLAVEGALMGLSAGFITIGIPALATLSGEEGMAGPVMSAMGVGAIIGTLWAGAKAKDIAPANGLRASTLLFAIALLPLAFVPIGPVDDGRGAGRLGVHRPGERVLPRGHRHRPAARHGRGRPGHPVDDRGRRHGHRQRGRRASIAESVSPHLTLALGSLFAIASPILFTIGMRGVLKPATQVTADGGPRRRDNLTALRARKRLHRPPAVPIDWRHGCHRRDHRPRNPRLPWQSHGRSGGHARRRHRGPRGRAVRCLHRRVRGLGAT